MNYTKSECSCETKILEGHKLIDYLCPKHKAAPELYEALEKAQQDINWMLNNRQFLNPECFEYIDEAIAKVEGGS